VQVDCWSLGAVLYVMLAARFPEFDRSSGIMVVKMESPNWASVSDSAKDLIRSLMNPDPAARFSIQQALAHPWTTGMPFHRHRQQGAPREVRLRGKYRIFYD
jgi:serine/threonine protein kinase